MTSSTSPVHPHPVPLHFTVNGEAVSAKVDPGERLLDVLRYRVELTGTKEGCGEGECGACTVWMDGIPVNSCLVPAWQAEGRSVETVESVEPEWLAPFLASGATQCGACTPGVVMTARWVVEHPELLRTHTLRELMAGNLCRCTGYDGIVDGLRAALAARGIKVPEARRVGEAGDPLAGSRPARPGGTPSAGERRAP